MNGDQFADGLLAISEELFGLTELPRKTADLAAPKIDAVITEELAQGVGPRGEPWEPLKDGSGRIPFSSSGRMRGQIKVTAEGLKVRGRLNAPWNVHQYGSRNPRKGTPARKVFQTGELSASWQRALDEAKEEAIVALTPKLAAAAGK